jgi:hypothetical protein
MSPRRCGGLALVLGFCCALQFARAQAVDVAPAAGASADALMDDVLLRLPREPITLTGQLFVRKPRGIPVCDYAFEMTLNYGAEPATASYAIRASPAGPVLEALTVKRPSKGEPEYLHADGSPSEPAPLQDLYGHIQQTDLTWLDLSLSFLWWRGGIVVGTESVRGRPSVVVDLAPPVGGTSGPYARVRVWIDEQARILLQAEGYDAAGNAVRTLWVKSFKKINDRWMIKDLEIQQYPAVHRTKLRVNEAQDAEGPAADAGSDL